MRQLKIAIACDEDVRRGRPCKEPKPVCAACIATWTACACVYTCVRVDSSQPSITGALQNAIYSHMQKCSRIPNEWKRALTNLKKVHAEQQQDLGVASYTVAAMINAKLKKIPIAPGKSQGGRIVEI
jgi:hypothetical protein